ncbi:Spindle pole body protein ppc89 [Pseudocercospora fuligena]|uniref:Spindle pole body protein ppc89 n=1 Tax=Pseudocercospora fuligena TaxID=685502 RepID=A0A8H6VQ61_9PEZI|nr:Spindle pole body protein ppc89 [Pseudocercospora fuligena]
MSIELGRGVKRSAQQQDHDLSSNAIFSFGNDNSQYDFLDTPPSRPRNAQRKSDGTLRKEASIRRATESARANDPMKRSSTGGRRAVSESQARKGAGVEPAQENATATVVGSRFAQRVSSSYNIPTRYTATAGLASAHNTPRRQTAGNATVQSTTNSINQSFMLPDVANITELISGTRANGTPLVRQTATTRSRFVSTSYKGDAQTQTHLPVTAVGLPEDEKAIFASLQMLHDRVNQLEQERNEAHKHIEEYEREVIELRSQLHLVDGRPDSGLGSEDDTREVNVFAAQKAKLQAKVKAAEDRLERSERKASVSNITVTRVTKERDILLSQLATAYFKNEVLEEENETFRESVNELRSSNEDLRARVQELEDENALLRAGHPAQGASDKDDTRTARHRTSSTRLNDRSDDISEGMNLGNKAFGGKQIKRPSEPDRTGGRTDQAGETIMEELASRTEREIQKHRDARTAERAQNKAHRQSTARSRSKSRRSTSFVERDDLHRRASAPVDTERTKSFSAGDDITQRSSRSTKLTEQFGHDLTILSDLDPLDVARLRRKLEEELQAKHCGHSEHVRVDEETAVTGYSTSHRSLSRKPSLKDTTTGSGRLDLGNDSIDDILKVTKSVRVQSPHTSDEISHSDDHNVELGHISSLSNISRRRRRTASADGMTSAFIIPDLELNTGSSLPTDLGSKCILHRASQCTACEHEDTQVEIPTPVPVTEREDLEDITNATIRPSQPPAEALAKVIKNLEDEIKHLKLKRDSKNRIYNQHEPALARRKRVAVRESIDALTAEIERKSDQVYALYDVLEGQKESIAGKGAQETNDVDVEETLQSLGIDPAELSGRLGRSAPVGLDALDDLSDASELPFEGFSEIDSEVGEDKEAKV